MKKNEINLESESKTAQDQTILNKIKDFQEILTTSMDCFIQKMKQDGENIEDQLVIKKLIQDNLDKLFETMILIHASASNENFFPSLTDLEKFSAKLRDEQRTLNLELILENFKLINEKLYIGKKKQEYLAKGIKLRVWRSFPKSIITTFGKFAYNRKALIPATKKDTTSLENLTKEKMIFPIDEFLGADKLPFKISADAMLEIAYRVQEVPSYEAAWRAIKRSTLIDVNEDTVRAVANHIGSIVFENDEKNAMQAWETLQSGKTRFPKTKRNHELYIEVDGSMLQTRKRLDENEKNIENQEPTRNSLDENEKPDHVASLPIAETCVDLSDHVDKTAKPNWTENQLGMVFSSDNFKWRRNNEGQLVPEIGKREYICYLGESSGFKKHLFAAAIKNGYGGYEKTILISDGATWIRAMKEELFPDAQQILNIYHLCEKVSLFSKDIFHNDENMAKQWANNICDLLRQSEWETAVKEIISLGEAKKSKSKINLVEYILNNKDAIDYAYYKEQGWHVGGGAIENADKTVLQSRLRQAGMRWNRDSGQFILSLTSKALSNLWDEQVVKPIRNLYDVEGAASFLSSSILYELLFHDKVNS
ncbi:MAG: hypothetical protein LBT62_01895 [Deltaproteobacteria bacterium]|jgi:hypothetical protein|nr:hypothetical protein [Deltaproteobacteria bacterium]